MSSKLVVPADIFNLFETEKFSKLQNERPDSSSSEISVKSDKIKNNEATAEETVEKENTENKTHKMESGDMNCSNKDKMVNNVDESQMNGEPPRETNVPSMTALLKVSSSQTVSPEGPAQHLEAKNTKNKIPVFLIKNASGKSVPLLIKKPVLLKNSETVDQSVLGNNNRTFIQVPNNLIANGNILKSPNSSTPILILTPNLNKTNEILINKPENSENPRETQKEKLEKSTEISTKISTEKSTDISAAQIKPKLVIDRKLVKQVKISTPINQTANSSSTVQEFVIKTSSGKQVIIPNKIKPLKIVPKVEISEKKVPKTVTKNVNPEVGKEQITQNSIKHNLLNTKSIIINNQLVPVNFNTKFTVENGSNTQKNETQNNDTNLNIITQKTVETFDKKSTKRTVDKTKVKLKTVQGETKVEEKSIKRKPEKLQKPKNIVKPAGKLYQLQVQGGKGPKLISAAAQTKNITKNCVKVKEEVDLLKECVQMPMYVENWTQTSVKLQDTACQTDIYVAPALNLEAIDEECPNIPELIEFLLDNPKYNTGMDEITKSDIMNNALKFKPPETAPIPIADAITPASPEPKLTQKERLFYDLRDCIGFDFLGNMPIHNAVIDNNLNDLKRQIFALRLRRFSVDVENSFNQTALQLAVINNKNEDVIATLLSNGANVSVKDNLGNTLVHLAVLNTNHRILDLILRYFFTDTNFINTKNDEGLTSLMVAAIEDKPESVAVLLKYGADPNLRDNKSGRTALFHAVELNNVPVIDWLLKNKADSKIRNFFGLTALDAVKDLNTPVGNLMEKQTTRTVPTSEVSTSQKKRANKRKVQGQPDANKQKPHKMAAVPKKVKVDVGSLEKQTDCPSGSEFVVPQMELMTIKKAKEI